MTAESIGVASSTPDGESLRTAYEQVCECHKDLTEFRAKLLALLPLASSAGIFVLLDGDAKAMEHELRQPLP